MTTSYKLRTGHTTSCGCEQKVRTSAALTTHGASAARSPTYRTWKEMRNRCRNPAATQWRWYGGRGVKVCARWETFENFLADMGPRPQGASIDRVNPDGDYTPDNCRWATAKQQAETNRGLFRKGQVPWNKKAPS